MTEVNLLDHIKPKPAPDGVKLGAHAGIADPRFPLLRDHVDRTVRVPATVHRSHREFRWPMLGNDTVGDCVIADIYHGIQHMRLGAARPVPAVTDSEALGVYSAITGYTPRDPSTDQGTDPTVAWAYWQQTGVPLPNGSTDRIAGTVQILPHDAQNFRRAIWEFDSVGMAVSLPLTAQGQTIWDVAGDPSSNPDAQPGSWGGHMIRGVSYDSQRIAFISWGQIMLMTWRFWGTYGEVALAGLSPDLINRGGVSETGVDYATLAHDLPTL